MERISRRYRIFLFAFLCGVFQIKAQTGTSIIHIELQNIKGGVYAGQTVTLASKDGKQFFSQKSNEKGEATFTVPAGLIYEVTVSNYTKKKEVRAENDAEFYQTITYEPDMVEKMKEFALSDGEKAQLDAFAKLLPDSIAVGGSVMKTPANLNNYSQLTLKVSNIEDLPLADEVVCFAGLKRKKKVTGITDKSGTLKIYLVKGDVYSLNFKHNKGYATVQSDYSKGTNTINLGITYLGTKEVERRIKEEADRVLAEEKRIKALLLLFEKECKRRGISIEEGRRLEMLGMFSNSNTAEQVVTKVLTRNKWEDKLIVCDLTGSMGPYYAQLVVWYQLKYKIEKNLQFVFFNDGDAKQDNQKVIGSTGGIYYSPAKGIDSLANIMSHVAAMGYGGDCPENNMEALIKGVKLAKPYKEIIMIADNNAPVKDISLLSKFNIPVHVILCGASSGYVGLDYLLLAWKTKGSIHTMEEDITKIATMAEGQDIIISGAKYRILGGEFVKITKM